MESLSVYSHHGSPTSGWSGYRRVSLTFRELLPSRRQLFDVESETQWLELEV